MSHPRRGKVHVDTPRPAPTSNRNINIRWHPERRVNRWGPRSHRLPHSTRFPRPPRFPVGSHLEDWGETGPCPGDADDFRNRNQWCPSGGSIPEGLSPKNMQTVSAAPYCGASQKNQGNSDKHRGEMKELSKDNLKSHDESDDGHVRGSESDEESSSSKRSREDMEDGDVEVANAHLKRSRLGEGTVNTLKAGASSTKLGGGDDKSGPLALLPRGASATENVDAEGGTAGSGCDSRQNLNVQYSLLKRDANNNATHGGGGESGKGVEPCRSGSYMTDRPPSASMFGTPISKRADTEGKMEFLRSNLGIQYTLDSNLAENVREILPQNSGNASNVFLTPKFRAERGKELECAKAEMETREMATLPSQRDQIHPEQKVGAIRGRTPHTMKSTGIHRSLQKQLQEKEKANARHPVAELRASETGSTEGSEDEKEEWKKVVESLTVNVKEMEPVPTLNRMLQRNVSPPVPPSVPPPFMHPWGLFPFGPMVNSFPYRPCHPFWPQQGPYYPPYPQMGQPVPSGMQFPPPKTLEDGASPPKTEHDRPAGMHVQAPGDASGRSRDSLPATSGDRSDIPPIDRRMPLLQDDDDLDENADGLSKRQGRKFQGFPAQRRANYTPGMDSRMPPLLHDGGKSGHEQRKSHSRSEGLYPSGSEHRSTPTVNSGIPLLQDDEDEEYPGQQQPVGFQSEGLQLTPGMPLLEDDDMVEQSQSLANVTPQQSLVRGNQSVARPEHIRFDPDEEVEDGEIRDSPPSTTPEDSTASGEEEGKESLSPAERGRKVYVPGKMKQLTRGKCDFSGKFRTPKVKEGGGCSFIRLLKRGESISIYTPNSTESSEEDSSAVPGEKATDQSQRTESNRDNMGGLQTTNAWRRDHRVIGPAPASAPPAVSTIRMPFNNGPPPQPYSACFRNQSETSPQNAFSTRGFTGNVPRAQLVARIPPRRRLTLQEEVMMEGIPKDFRHQFGFPTDLPSQLGPSRTIRQHLELGLVYPWSSVEYIDTHCHIDFLYQRLGHSGTFEKFGRARGFPDNYGGCVAIFCTPDSFHPSNQTWQNLLKEDKIWAAFGCHPHHIKNYDGVVETNILRGMMHKKAIAFGEIGLDYSNRNASDHDLQHMVFKRQLALAMQLQKPLVIHSREAESDTLDIMVSMVPRDYKIHRHCFTGPPEDARAFMDAFPNSFIGLTNLVTFPTATETHRTARELPLDRLLLETDAPYFLPRQCPKEIRWSHPAMAVFVAEKIARLRGISTDEVLRAVRKNTTTMYGI